MEVDWKQLIKRLVDRGAEYADVRYVPKEENDTLIMWNGNLMTFDRSEERGYGVRVLVNGAWGFAASSCNEDAKAVFDRAFDNAAAAAKRSRRPIRLADKDIVRARFESPCGVDPFEVPLLERVEAMKEIDSTLQHKDVLQRVVAFRTTRKTIQYTDSEGAEIEKYIIEIFPSIQVGAFDPEGVMQQRGYRPPRLGPTRGWELMNKEHWKRESDRVVSELFEVIAAPSCPSGNYSVILMPDMMFLQVHETIGHPLELDRILGYELSFAGGSFVRLDDFGKLQYGSEKLNVRADATLINSPGSFGFDDDGVVAKNRMLIEKGILTGAITSRQMVMEANDRAGRKIFPDSGGTSRACSFYRVPIERMTNINVDPGEDGTLEDIIKDTERGVILSGEKSWSIGSTREQFHFATDIGWLVEDGEKKSALRNCTYEGMTLDFYRSLSKVGDESTWEVQFVDNCGKGAPSQEMQLGHGVPVCRFDNVKVGE